MPKSSNYSEQEFNLISNYLAKVGINTIAQLETFAAEINREVWSLYSFIKRKLDVDLFPDRKIKKAFRLKYSGSTPRPKKEKRSPAKIIHFNENSSGKRPPAIYSNLDVVKFANDLLKD